MKNNTPISHAIFMASNEDRSTEEREFMRSIPRRKTLEEQAATLRQQLSVAVEALDKISESHQWDKSDIGGYAELVTKIEKFSMESLATIKEMGMD